MASPPYSKPPITEAVIELRTDGGASEADLDRSHRKLLKAYGQVGVMEEVEFDIKVNESDAAPVTRRTGNKQWRLSSEDGTWVAILAGNRVSVSRLAPYVGWDDLFDRTQEVWTVWREQAGKRPLRRIGVRYINRFDIPASDVGVIDLSDYLLVAVQRPATMAGVLAETAAVVRVKLDNSPCWAMLNVGTAPPALIDHVSATVDLDVYLEVDLPRRDDDMWQKLLEIRALKNSIFESCITDRARELIA